MAGTRRGTSELLDTIDEHGAAVNRTSLTLRTALMDGVVDDSELVDIDRCLAEMLATYQRVNRDGLTIDATFALVRTLAHTGNIRAPQVKRSYRELTTDLDRLDGIVPVDQVETTYAAD